MEVNVDLCLDDDDTGEPLEGEDLTERLKELLCDGDLGIGLDEIVGVEVL